MNQLKLGSLLLLFISMLSCKKDNEDPEPINQAPDDFSVTVTVERKTANLTWTAASDPDGDVVTYTVMLEDAEVANNITNTEYTIEDLEYSQSYSGKIIASDEEGETSEALFSFTTDDPGPEGTVFLSGEWFYELDLSTGALLDSTEQRYSSFLIQDDIIFRTSENTIEAVSLDGRSELWSFDFTSDSDFETTLNNLTVIDDDVVFSSTVVDLSTYHSTFNLYSFDKNSGDENWSKSTPSIISPALKLKNKLMMIEQGEPGFKNTTYLSSRNFDNGDLSDSLLLGKRIASRSPVVDDEAIYLLDWEGVVSSFDASPSENWSSTVSGEPLTSSSIFYENRLFFNSRDGKTYGVDLESGAISWEINTTSTGEYGSGIDVYENSLIIAGGNFIKRINVMSKEEIWSYEVELPSEVNTEGFGSFVVINDFILYSVPFAISEDEERTAIVLLSASDGELLWNSTIYATAGGSATAVSEGEVYYDNSSFMK